MWSASKSSSHELSSINHFEIGAIHVQPTSCATSAKHPTPPKYIPGPVPCNKPGQDCETSPSIVAITAAEPPKIACPTLYLRDHAYVLQRSAHEKVCRYNRDIYRSAMRARRFFLFYCHDAENAGNGTRSLRQSSVSWEGRW